MAVLATWITSQLVFNGLIAGLEIGLLAMGIVLIYRSTRVINFAVGNMGLVGASLLALLVIEFEVPFWLAAIGSLIVGTLFGTIMALGASRFAPSLAQVGALCPHPVSALRTSFPGSTGLSLSPTRGSPLCGRRPAS